MRKTLAVLVILAGVIGVRGAETEKGKDNGQGPQHTIRFSRETPTVLAVRKTRDSIVSLKVQKSRARKETVGTGVIIDERGYIITNRHVVKDALAIRVFLFDGTYCSAELQFEDSGYDLAVVKISTKRKLRALRLGPASDVMVGEEVIAIGHPFGYTNTVSKGIVSAVGREIEMGGITLTNLIQTTASINPGNSGGPLLNINGELIGINVALRSDAQNIAFALNADMVQQVLSRRLSASRRTGFYHGLDCRERVQLDGEARCLVVVHDVAEGTPAAAAGLKEGDQIVRLGDLRVGNRFDIERALWDSHAGEKVTVSIIRGGRTVNLQMPLVREAARAGGTAHPVARLGR
jgi:S1-C subfamily serine protease